MDTPQAAASLFGLEDSSSDPFAIIGEDSAQNAVMDTPQGNTTLYGSAGQGDPVGGQPGHPEYEVQSNYAEYHAHFNHAEASAPWDASTTNVVNETQQYPPYELPGSTTHYERQGTFGSGYNGTTSHSQTQSNAQYDPSSYFPATSQPANTWIGASVSVDPYAPVTSSTGASSYDPYSQYSRPSVASQYSPYATPAYSAPPLPPIPTQPTIPTPATPPVPKPLDRPKVSNAYDPPFPTTKSRRSGRSIAAAQPAYGNYSAYQAPIAPQAPPARATPPPPKAHTYSQHNVSAPTSYARSGDHPSSQQLQPSTINQYASPLSMRQHSTSNLKPLSPPIQSHARSPAATTTDISLWSTDEVALANLATGSSHIQNTPDHHTPYEQIPVEALNEAARDCTPPAHEPEQNQDINQPSPLIPGATQTSSYVPLAAEHSHDVYQLSNLGPPVPTHGIEHQSPRVETKDPYAPAWSENIAGPRTKSPAPSTGDKAPVQPPHQVYSPPPQVYSPPPQRSIPVQSFANESLLDQPAYGAYAIPVPPPTVPQTYQPPPIPASNSNNTHLNKLYGPHRELAPLTSSTSLYATSLAYAPSPSLLGTNDPLSRTTARAPVINFGFGGRLVTCFHGADTLSTGFDVALSNRNTTSIQVHVLQTLLPKAALEQSEVEYPGPLFPDSSNASLTLVRTAASSQGKGKKPRVLKYLEDRMAEISQGLAYQGPQDREVAEAKLVLTSLLKVLVENDGQLLGSPQSEAAVRAALVPHIAVQSTDRQEGNEFMPPTLYSTNLTIDSSEPSTPVTTLTSSALSRIGELLMRGERRQAYTYALDQRLWAHAMVIASSIDKEAWKEVVNDFIHTELATKDPQQVKPVAPVASQTASGKESLRVAYSLFSGQGAAAVKELVPTKLSSLASGRQPPSSIGHAPTPRTPAFPQTPIALAPPAALSQWRETVAMMVASPLSQDASSALTALGDQLMSYGWIQAAHACYLLSPVTSPVGGTATPAARISLLGCGAPQQSLHFPKDSDAFIFSEILEFALSLMPVAKGLEPFAGLPHLQAYRLVRASSLAEMGDIQVANRYCEAISHCVSKGSPYFNPTIVSQLRILTERINGVTHSEKSSWIGGKISKPSLDTIGGWLDRRFTKLVTGDGDSETNDEDENKKAAQRTFDGPFNHYSTISTTPSGRSSPQPMAPQYNAYVPPPQRTSSAMAVSAYHPSQPIDRASSAVDYLRNNSHQQSGQPVATPFAYGNPHNHSSPALGLNTRSQPEQMNGGERHSHQSSTDSPDGDSETPVQGGSSWWDYSNPTSQTPTAATFMQVDEPVVSESPNGFISLMDDQQFSFQPKSASAPPAPARPRAQEEDEEDLGFGNKKPNAKPSPTEEAKTEPAKQPTSAPAAKPEASSPQLGQQAPAGGWLSRWWKGGGEPTTGPIKAKLGEENSFYYDKELKRWVNKKAGAEETKPTPPPPPPRAATASPSRGASRPPMSSSAPPPARSNSAMELASPAEQSAGRVRSNLVPLSAGTPPPMGGIRPPSVAPPGNGPPLSRPPSAAPPGFGGLPPPGSRPPSTAPTPPASRAGKKSIRSRYVDVFQQDNAGQ